MKTKKIISIAFIAIIAFSIIVVIIGCTTGTGVSSGTLYMTDTFNGRVYTFDMDNNIASSAPVLSTGQNATGMIFFYNDIGYITVGNSSTTDAPGVYRFDPSAQVPVAERIGKSISAQYIAFYSLTKAYVTDADVFSSTGVYTFNPLDPDAGLSGPIPGTDDMAGGMYLQDITAVGGMVYVADNGKGQVLVIDPTTDTLAASSPIPASAGGTTGLLTVRDSDGNAAVYVANNGGYDAMFNPLPGSIDVIDTSTNILKQAVSNVSATQIEYDSVNDSFFGTGYTNTYRIDPASGTAVEIKNKDNQSFGGTDIVASGGKVYISNTDYTSSKLYILDGASAETAESPVSIMVDGEDAVAGLAVY